MLNDDIQEIVNKLSLFDKIYENIRLVDPERKKVISYSNNQLSESSIRCFDFWDKNKACDNCISIRAYNEDKTFVKIEYSMNKVFMVTSIPYELEHRKIVIELLKDATDSMIIDSNQMIKNNTEIYTIIDNMNQLILKDPLTEVYNRRYISERLPIDILEASLSEQEISIIMADIDFFKQVNDIYGHLAGDEVLQGFTNVISDCLTQEGEWVARFGGEEFLICLPGSGLSDTIKVVETIRKQVEAMVIDFNDSKINITSSFGICVAQPDSGSKVEDMIQYADKKLYEAKMNGKNRFEY
jgi:diguanylate cyclase (GGDEF) domain